MRSLLLVAALLCGLAAPRAEAAVVVYDLTLTPTNGSVGGTGTLVFNDAFGTGQVDFSSFTVTAPDVTLFTITVGGQTFDLTNSFTNVRVNNGTFVNFGTNAFVNGIAFGSSDTTYTFFNIFTGASATGQISAELHVSAAVPEPSTWVMMILGFAALGALAYRRSRRIDVLQAA